MVYFTCDEIEEHVRKNIENIKENETLAVSNVEFCRDDGTINIELYVVPKDDIKCNEKKRLKIRLDDFV